MWCDFCAVSLRIEVSEFARWWDSGPGQRFKQLRCTAAEKAKLDWAARAFRQADADASGYLDAAEFGTIGLVLQRIFS